MCEFCSVVGTNNCSCQCSGITTITYIDGTSKTRCQTCPHKLMSLSMVKGLQTALLEIIQAEENNYHEDNGCPAPNMADIAQRALNKTI